MRQPAVNSPVSGRWPAAAAAEVAPRTLAPVRREAFPRLQSTTALARLLELVAALALLVLAAPILAVALLFVLLVDGRPVLYRGERLGRGKRPFQMYKVRTLRRDAGQLTAGRLLASSDRLEIRGGRFLRESRLDELPQLWNIVRGEMTFVGPRPERESVYRIHCQSIPGYTRRFAVRPGMLGPSQLFTPHATHKRIRTWLDNGWCRRERTARELVCLTVFTALAAGRKAVARALESLGEDFLRARVLRQYREKRRLRRVSPEGAIAILAAEGNPRVEMDGLLVDMNEEALLVRSPCALHEGASVRVRVAIQVASRRFGPGIRHATCTAVVRERRRVGTDSALVLGYEPVNARSAYVIHQYFLRNSLACPRGRVRARRRSDGTAWHRMLRPMLRPIARRTRARQAVPLAGSLDSRVLASADDARR